MRQTHFHDDHRQIVPGRAVGYSVTEAGGFEISQTTLEMIGDGGVFTTVEDLALWDDNFYEPRVGTRETLARMVTPGELNDGEEMDYASGLFVTDYQGLRKVSHGGAFVGYRAQMIRFPDQRLSVICLCNRSDANPSARAQAVADLYLADHLTVADERADGESAATAVELSIEELDAFTGAYQREGRSTVIRVERVESGLILAFSSKTRPELAAVAPRRFVGTRRGATFVVAFDDEGATLSFGADRDESRYRRVELVTPSTGAVEELAGDYRCEELMTTVRLTAENTSLRLSHENPHKNAPESPFVPTVVDTFERVSDHQGQPPRFTIAISRGEDGSAEAIHLGVGRVRNIACVPIG